jgi:hypothetical protein
METQENIRIVNDYTRQVTEAYVNMACMLDAYQTGLVTFAELLAYVNGQNKSVYTTIMAGALN